MKKSITILKIVVVYCSMASTLVAATGQIGGFVLDEDTGIALPAANVRIDGTYLGAASDLQGQYLIVNVPPGVYTMTVTYMGYQPRTVEIKINANEKSALDVALTHATVQGKEVVVTAQAAGQQAAINQQINAISIKNVVSSARIQELPDATAAESIGRLPGVSINRSGGEANKVTVRGLAPRYNSVQVEGVTMGSTDQNDRSVDISMISPNALSGIEITKAITPDMEANSLGGTINMTLREAPDEFKTDFLVQGGFDAQQESYNNYKVVGSISNRFLDKKFGVYLNGYVERRNRSTDQLDADFEEVETVPMEMRSDTLRFTEIEYEDRSEIRKRIGGTLVLDYRLRLGSLKFTNFASRMDQDILTHRQDVGSVDHRKFNQRIVQSGENLTIQMVNRLAGEFNVLRGKLDFSLSHSLARRDQPEERSIHLNHDVPVSVYGETDNYLDLITGMKRIEDFTSDPGLTGYYGYMRQITKNKRDGRDREYSAQLNYERPFRLGRVMNGFVKFGGKGVLKNRFFDREQHQIGVDRNQYSNIGKALFDLMPDVYVNRNSKNDVAWPDAVDDHFDNSRFFNGKYNLQRFIGIDNFNRTFETAFQYYEDNGFIVGRNPVSSTNDQDGTETTVAGYVMTQLNFLDNKVSLIPGVRHERLNYNYRGFIWEEPRESEGREWKELSKPDTAETDHIDWFPMLHLRVKPLKWLDLRLAYTNTASRPNYTDLIPALTFDTFTKTATKGNPDLEPQLSENWDLTLSAYSNKIGLFALGLFTKSIDNLTWRAAYFIPTAEDAAQFGLGANYQGYTVNTALNSPYAGKLKGFEVSWQNSFWFMPFPFNGIVLDVNYTLIQSETRYPLPLMKKVMVPGSRIPQQVRVDSSYTGPIQGQPENVFNVSIGYDFKGFSGRLSYLYQDGSRSSVTVRPYLSTYASAYSRWDIKLSQDISKKVEVFLNVNNITDSWDETYQQQKKFISNRQAWGLTMDFGVRYRL